MLFSKTCEYALRAAIYIATQSSKDRKIGIIEICENIEAPQHFTAKILQILTRHKIVHSQKGVNGGFFMEKEQLALPLKSLVEAIEGHEWVSRCGLGLNTCSSKKPCPLHDQYKKIRQDILKLLTDKSIGNMAFKIKKGNSVLRNG